MRRAGAVAVSTGVHNVSTCLGTAFVLVLRAIARPRGWSWLVPVAAFPATLWTVAMGQNAFLNAALLSGFTLLLQHRPLRAGALLGALCIKPHLAILAPVALIVSRRWRAAASTVTAVLSLASFVLYQRPKVLTYAAPPPSWPAKAGHPRLGMP
ncbi:MAG TPA: glycosyltransferase family 87 protein, partial [Acetobacteraceae bacterium]|nr:glycosyltransferase family 87 protein [Acetobacteraceae bacterium]